MVGSAIIRPWVLQSQPRQAVKPLHAHELDGEVLGEQVAVGEQEDQVHLELHLRHRSANFGEYLIGAVPRGVGGMSTTLKVRALTVGHVKSRG